MGFARGPLYGFVVHGPCDDARGGPSLAGAWAVATVLVVAATGFVRPWGRQT